MSREIKSYTIVRGPVIDVISEVNGYLAQGWVPWGDAHKNQTKKATTDWIYHQVMVKYKEEVKE